MKIPGKENVLSDYVSRNIAKEEKWEAIDINYLELSMVCYNEEELIEKQLNDGFICEVINLLNGDCVTKEFTEKYKKYRNKLVVENNILKYDHHGKLLYVCPEELRTELLSLGHDQFYSGHQGAFKTLKRLLENV